MICTIFAYDQNGGFANEIELPWGNNKTEDLKIFKELTKTNIVIMGWNTFASLNYKALPNRLNIVVTNRQTSWKEGVLFLKISDVDNLIDNWNSKKRSRQIFIIGGLKLIYRYLNYYDLVMITEFHDRYKSTLYVNKNIIREFCTNPCMTYESVKDNFTFTIYCNYKCDDYNHINNFLYLSKCVIDKMNNN